MKAYWGVEVLDGVEWSASRPADVPLEKEPLVHIGPQSRSGRGGEEINSQPLPGLEPPIIQPVAQRYTAELPRFLTYSTGTEVIDGSISNTLLFADDQILLPDLQSVIYLHWNLKIWHLLDRFHSEVKLITN
jgi:hypothetical protein